MYKAGAALSKNQLSLLFAALLGFAMMVGLAGCGGSSSDDPIVPPEDASGLFTGVGTVNNGTSLTDVRGFVHADRFIFFDGAEAVLYDGQITNIAEDDVTAAVDVYKDGAITATGVAVNGTVTSQSSMSLSLNGTGYAAGSLSLTFDPQYNRSATIDKLARDNPLRWVGDAHTPTTTISGHVSLRSANDGAPDDVLSGDSSAPSQCFYDGFQSIPDSAINVYTITLEVTDVGGTCDHIGSGYTGFFAVVDGVGTDDTLLFAAANDTFSNFSIMTKQ